MRYFSTHGRYISKLNAPDSALNYAEKGRSLAQSLNRVKNIQKANRILAEIYAKDKPELALDYYQKYVKIKDEIYNVAQVQSFQNAVSEDSEKHAAVLRAKQDYIKQVRFYGLLAGLLILVIVLWIIYRNYHRKLSDNLVLSEQKAEIEKTLGRLKSTQAQLIQSEKMASLGELTAGIAHEIQNPLNFVNNFSEVTEELVEELQEEGEKESEERDLGLEKELIVDIKDNLKKINHHGQRASGIVKGMLEHSKSSSGTKELTDINALANEYIKLSHSSMEAKDESFKVDLETNFDKSLPKFEVIPSDIGRVILNLANNAFQAVHDNSLMPEILEGRRGSIANDDSSSALQGASGDSSALSKYKPLVSIKTKLTAESQMLIAITDNGPGIPDEIKDKIFQPFFTTKDTGKGTGLGLSLAYDIVRAHGGELTMESELSKGTEFFILLPIK